MRSVVKFSRNGLERRSATCVSGVPPPEIAVPAPKVVAPPPGDAVPPPHCIFGKLIFGKIITTVATRGRILRLTCTKFYFGWDSAPDPAGAAYSAPPDPLAGFKGPTSKGREGKGGKGKGWEGGKGGEEMYSSTTYF